MNRDADLPTPPAATEPVAGDDGPLTRRRMPRQARSRRTVEAILKAASEEIERSGLDNLTTNRIAVAAGVSIGGLYEFFPNKEAILYAMLTSWTGAILESVRALHPAQDGGRDLLGYLDQMAETCLVFYRSQPGLPALLDASVSIIALRDAMRVHDGQIVAEIADGLAWYVPKADRKQAEATAHTILLISHDLLMAASQREEGYAGMLLKNLRVCLYALATRLQLG